MGKISKNHLKAFLPSAKALIATWIAVGILLIGCSCAGIYGAAEEQGAFLENAGFVLGFVTFPPLALVLEIAALLEKRALPKALMGILAVGALIIAAVLGSIGFAASDEGAGDIWAMGCLFTPLILLFSIVVVYALPRVAQEWREVMREDHETRAVAFIKAHGGETTYEELSQTLGISEEDVDALLLDLIHSKQLIGAREIPYQRFYTAIALQEKRMQILGRVQARGQIPLDELAFDLQAPVGLVKEWLYRLVQSGKFTGYINWDEGTLYSAEAERLRDAGRCPHCGGELGLAGKGVIRCGNCGSEVFL